MGSKQRDVTRPLTAAARPSRRDPVRLSDFAARFASAAPRPDPFAEASRIAFERAERLELVHRLRGKGLPLAAIARRIGLSRQRVHQLLARTPGQDKPTAPSTIEAGSIRSRGGSPLAAVGSPVAGSSRGVRTRADTRVPPGADDASPERRHLSVSGPGCESREATESPGSSGPGLHPQERGAERPLPSGVKSS